MEVTHRITTQTMTQLNEVVSQLIKNHFLGTIQLVDAFLPLQARYQELCRKYDFPDDMDKQWFCSDKMHSGDVINDHYGQMILNYLCND